MAQHDTDDIRDEQLTHPESGIPLGSLGAAEVRIDGELPRPTSLTPMGSLVEGGASPSPLGFCVAGKPVDGARFVGQSTMAPSRDSGLIRPYPGLCFRRLSALRPAVTDCWLSKPNERDWQITVGCIPALLRFLSACADCDAP